MRSVSAPSTAPPPERIGTRYQMVAELGRGGMAVVYRVLDTSNGIQLALKQALSQKHAGRDREVHALFESEFHTLAQLKHPSVIAVYDYGVDTLGPYYTMELLDGGDLTNAAPLPYRRACELMMQISSSLSLLHARGLLHRDISPRNVRYTSDGHAKLIDFGAMAVMGPCTQVVGTPAFIAPEVAHRLTLDARTDLFSLGVTLYYALTGRFAYPARSLSDLRDVWRQEPHLPSELIADIPPALDELVSSLIRIDPAGRPRNAFEVMQRLAAIAGVMVSESDAVSQAYLSTPVLVGRERELAQFREHMQLAVTGRGGALLFDAPPGSGRSRMLDACVIEAKAVGATVLRMRGVSADGVAFVNAHALAEQLCETLPQYAAQYAREAGAQQVLFEIDRETSGEEPRLAPLANWRSERYALQVALADWIKRACRDRPLMIAVDDAERIDEASVALLAALAHAAKSHAISIVAMVASNAEDAGALSLQVLRGQCVSLPLPALTLDQTQALFASVFASAPHVTLAPTVSLPRARPREERGTCALRWFSSDAFGDEHADAVRLELLKSTYRMEPGAHAALYAAGGAALRALELDIPVAFYQAQTAGGMNAALCYLLGEAHVVLPGPILATFSRDELTALIGHELAHYKLWSEDEGSHRNESRGSDGTTPRCRAEPRQHRAALAPLRRDLRGPRRAARIERSTRRHQLRVDCSRFPRRSASCRMARSASAKPKTASAARTRLRAVSFHRLEAAPYENRRNPKEARYIAELVRELLSTGTGLSLGIVAFSEAQQDEIEHALNELAADDASFRSALDAELEREEDEQFCGLFIKNLENVQGDERDMIILSVCYAPDAKGRMLMNFGPINKNGGEKRLNVIFSRAKQHIAVVSSIDSTQITNEYNDGANTLRGYLRYAAAASRGDAAEVNSVLASLSAVRAVATPRARADALKNALAEALRARGFELRLDVGRIEALASEPA